ncbi:MAG: sporulation protein [Candidatus Schekmanbacteria bacterium]|nr:sporulation protein [Candidatus Schekmanbacteria bacterium]
MGWFDALGFGGGKLDIQLEEKRVSPGGSLRGRVIFRAGKREQEVKSIQANVSVTTYRMEPGPSGPQRASHAETIVKDRPIASAFTSEPGNTYDFDFAISLPQELYNSDPQDVEYRLRMTADIDGEVDPGDGETFSVLGGRPYPKQVFGAAVPGMGLVPGAAVLAQWTDGSWQQARIVSATGNMIAVDWMDPRLGATAWLQPQQVVAAAGPGGQPMMGAPLAPGQPFPGQPFPGQQMPGAPMMGQPMLGSPLPGAPFGGQPAGFAPMAAPTVPGQPFGAPPFPGHPQMGAPAMQQPIGVGSSVLAQWTDGNWYPGAIVQVHGNLFGIDWQDPRLGASSWVQAHQIQPR